MKKIITLLFCTTVFASAFAQTNRSDRNDRNTNVNPDWNSNANQVYQKDHDWDDKSGRDDKRYNNNNTVNQNNRYSISQRDMQIQRISSQYDYRIRQVSYDRSLSNRQKRIAIKSLQAQKAQQIKSIYSQYNNSNVYNNSHNRNDDYKHNNRDNGYGQYNR
jgi:Ni/Co efflux regulator RcnB